MASGVWNADCALLPRKNGSLARGSSVFNSHYSLAAAHLASAIRALDLSTPELHQTQVLAR